ncbi:MAG: 30S ribosomal protein S11 [Kiritimatiellae bacterium]|nr:30S ribosomal protein S11 [Kiritimatiellia bacterium]
MNDEKADIKNQEPSAAAEAAAEETATADAATGEATKTAKKQKFKGARHVPFGIVHITATFNNTMVSISDMRGGVIAWSTAGRSGFKGSRKSTAFAATMASQDAARQALNYGLQEVEVRVQGPGAGRESAIRALQAAGLTVSAIKDVTPMPHNGCRARKRRRV